MGFCCELPNETPSLYHWYATDWVDAVEAVPVTDTVPVSQITWLVGFMVTVVRGFTVRLKAEDVAELHAPVATNE